MRRSRFMLEVYGAVREAVGDGLPLTARLAVEDSVPAGCSGTSRCSAPDPGGTWWFSGPGSPPMRRPTTGRSPVR